MRYGRRKFRKRSKRSYKKRTFRKKACKRFVARGITQLKEWHNLDYANAETALGTANTFRYSIFDTMAQDTDITNMIGRSVWVKSIHFKIRISQVLNQLTNGYPVSSTPERFQVRILIIRPWDSVYFNNNIQTILSGITVLTHLPRNLGKWYHDRVYSITPPYYDASTAGNIEWLTMKGMSIVKNIDIHIPFKKIVEYSGASLIAIKNDMYIVFCNMNNTDSDNVTTFAFNVRTWFQTRA